MSEDGARILIVTQASGFPNGGAAATALERNYALGMARAGADVSVHMLGAVAFAPTVGVGGASKGEWRGVPFEYMHGTDQPVSGWFRRRALELQGVWRMGATIRACGRSTRRTAVIIFGPLLRFTLPIKVACVAARVPLVHERGEFPFVYDRQPGWTGRLWRSAYVAIFFRLFDGVIVVSSLLEEYVRGRVRKAAWVLRVPTMVDADAFCCPVEPNAGLFGYAGNLTRREELLQLLESVRSLADRHDDVRVCIMGGGTPAEVAALEAEVARLGVEDRVELAGMVPGDDLPARLCACAALALPRARGLFSNAGFPTKLGEYLATGRPVVVTATGDIPLCIRPDVDAFVVPPDDAQAFTAALERALFEPKSADVGRTGREAARSLFDPATQMARVLEALESSW